MDTSLQHTLTFTRTIYDTKFNELRMVIPNLNECSANKHSSLTQSGSLGVETEKLLLDSSRRHVNVVEGIFEK